MALTDIDKVRLLTGDTDENDPILSDAQVYYYIETNDNDIDKAVEDVKIAISQILAIRAVNIRTEDMWEDNRDASKRYNESLDKVAALKGSSAYPVIGGGTYKGATVNQFDDENDYEDPDSITYSGIDGV